MSFKADDAETGEILAYAKARHFKNVPDFIRFAVFAYIRQNQPGGHRRHAGMESGNGSGRGAPPLDSEPISTDS